MAAYDPLQISPDFNAQKQALARAYNSGLINLNASKNQLFANQGLLNPGDYTNSGNSIDFSKLSVDPNSQYGGYRDELQTEADMLDKADEAGSGRGFSGGLSQQASRTARQAVGSRQTAYQQNLQSQLGNLNLQAGNQNFQYNEGITGVNNNAAEYGANAALWQGLNPTAAYSVPGASGGGSTPIKPTTYAPAPVNAVPQGVYNRTGPETAGYTTVKPMSAYAVGGAIRT